MSRQQDLRAELALLDMEADFRERKLAGEEPTMAEKLELRAAREQFRSQRAAGAVVSPDTVSVSAGVAEIGG